MTSKPEIKLDLTNLTAAQVGEHGLDAEFMAALPGRVRETQARLTRERKQKLHPHLAPALRDEALEAALRVAGPHLGKFSDLVLLGIGGSSLGLQMLVQALAPVGGPTVRLHVIDNTDPALYADVSAAIDLKDTLFVAVSKSGSTLETVAALGYFVARLRKAKLDLASHLLVITDPAAGPMRSFVDEAGLDSAEIPEGVSGRFSVLTAAGLLPAALMGLDVAAILTGAARFDTLRKGPDPGSDWPARLALCFIELCRLGKRGLVFMPYGSRLACTAHWFVQLWDESLGKGRDVQGKPVETGQTVIPALGASDQHAQMQLFMDGPNDKLTCFVTQTQFVPEIRLPEIEWGALGADYLNGRSLTEIIQAQHAGTADALASHNRPNATLTLPRLDAPCLGELILGLELATTYAAYELNVNPYDQPAVELGKRNSAKRIKAEG